METVEQCMFGTKLYEVCEKDEHSQKNRTEHIY